MSCSPQTQPGIRSRPLWRLSVGLLLLCGFINWTVNWTLATPRATSQLAVPLFVDQVEQLALASGTENLRTRPTLRRDGTAPANKKTDGSDGSLFVHTAVALSPGLSSPLVANTFSPFHLPASSRYTLPASREKDSATEMAGFEDYA